ncbi:hypothetical protein PUN28_014995 [Cardiocondyla obscurior]|uniref:Uncharacterized protein n=1 Tax=Cardiocondyla obscurior TaxID=286306 RepID=A0AAW2F2D8_9HYME
MRTRKGERETEIRKIRRCDGEWSRDGGGCSHWATSREDLYHSARTHTLLHLTYAKRGPRRSPSAQINVTGKQKRSLPPLGGPWTPARAGALSSASSRPVPLGPAFAPPLRPPRKGQPYFSDVIDTKARSRVEGRRGRATRKVPRRGVPELAGFTRAVTKHLLSLAAAPRSRLPQARLPLVCYCLFFHRLSPSRSPFLPLLVRRRCVFLRPGSCLFDRSGIAPLPYRSTVPIVRQLSACVYLLSRVTTLIQKSQSIPVSSRLPETSAVLRSACSSGEFWFRLQNKETS